MSVKLFKGDCLELLKQVKDESIDLVLADLPYGMTANKWDSVIPLAPLFEQYQRIIKPHGAVLLFGMGKFGAQLIMNAPAKLPYRYDWVWQKTMPVGFFGLATCHCEHMKMYMCSTNTCQRIIHRCAWDSSLIKSVITVIM